MSDVSTAADGPGAADVSRRPVFRWLVRLVAVSAVVALPWAAYLAESLPPSVSARHWPLAWAWLDVALAAGLAATAWLAIRRDRIVAFPAVSTATLLIADAWFDVCTAPAGSPMLWALADAGVEVGEALGCLLLAVAIWRAGPRPSYA
jgi:hypothetical protein